MEHLSELERLGLIIFSVLVAGLALNFLRQPRVAGYLIVGLLVGPHGLGLSPTHEVVEFISAMGVVFLLFFIGMEVNLERLMKGWRVSVLGTLLQVVLSVGFAWFLSRWYGSGTLGDIILTGFVISLSSTAVVLTMLQNWKELESRVGQDVLGILLVQDLIVVPMLIVIGLFGGEEPTVTSVAKELLGGLLVCGFVGWILVKKTIPHFLPAAVRRKIDEDPELEVFAGLAICLGFATLTTLFGLSEAMGAFVAGIFISAAGLTERAHGRLYSFKAVFVALFFVSIGMLVDVAYVEEHWRTVCWLVLFILFINTLINTMVVRLGKRTWRESLYAGVLLSQIGEFSFVLAAVGAASGIWSEDTDHLAYAVIALSLLVSPLYIGMAKSWLGVGTPGKPEKAQSL